MEQHHPGYGSQRSELEDANTIRPVEKQDGRFDYRQRVRVHGRCHSRLYEDAVLLRTLHPFAADGGRSSGGATGDLIYPVEGVGAEV